MKRIYSKNTGRWEELPGTTSVEKVTIPSGESLSNALDLSLSDDSVFGVVMPPDWTAADISIEVSADGTNFVPLYWNDAEYTLVAGINIAISFEISALAAWEYVKIRSGTSAVPVNQAADRVIVVLTREI